MAKTGNMFWTYAVVERIVHLLQVLVLIRHGCGVCKLAISRGANIGQKRLAVAEDT